MISVLLIFFSALTWSLPLPGDWSSAFKVIERHEFYPEGKVISEPRESWQHIFSILILNEEFREQKDCVYYYVPGENLGRVKVKTIGVSEDCLDHLLKEANQVWNGVKDLQYTSLPSGLKLTFTQNKETVSWEIVTTDFKAPLAAMHVSSSEMKSPRFVLLAPVNETKIEKSIPLKNDQLCFGVNDDCEETQASTCHLCPEGWYEVPNGCPKGPKFCGRLQCGGKNEPACRRGMKYQRVDKKFDCRTDSSFAYCQKGLLLQCEGLKAYCR